MSHVVYLIYYSIFNRLANISKIILDFQPHMSHELKAFGSTVLLGRAYAFFLFVLLRLSPFYKPSANVVPGEIRTTLKEKT